MCLKHRDMFKILGKYEVMIPEEDEMKLEGLPNAWMNFQQCHIDSTAMMKKYKVTYSVGSTATLDPLTGNTTPIFILPSLSLCRRNSRQVY